MTVVVEQAPTGTSEQITERLKEMTGSNRSSRFTFGSRSKISLAGVTNAQALADIIDFGTVTRVDVEKNEIAVTADPNLLPAPEPDDDSFETLCLNLLSSNQATRLKAVRRVREQAPFPQKQHEAMIAALTIRTRDTDVFVKNEARGTLRHVLDLGPQGEPSEPTLSETEVAGVRLVPRQVLNGRLELLVPESFAPLSAAALQAKYPQANRPETVFSDDSTGVNIAITYSPQKLQPSQLGDVHKVLDQTMRRAQPEAEWHDSRLLMIDDRQWAILDFTAQAIDTRIRNQMFATATGGRLLIAAVNVTEQQESQWREALTAVTQSLRVIKD